MKQRAINGGNDEYFTKVEVARKCISELISLIGNDFLFILFARRKPRHSCRG